MTMDKNNSITALSTLSQALTDFPSADSAQGFVASNHFQDICTALIIEAVKEKLTEKQASSANGENIVFEMDAPTNLENFSEEGFRSSAWAAARIIETQGYYVFIVSCSLYDLQYSIHSRRPKWHTFNGLAYYLQLKTKKFDRFDDNDLMGRG